MTVKPTTKLEREFLTFPAEKRAMIAFFSADIAREVLNEGKNTPEKTIELQQEIEFYTEQARLAMNELDGKGADVARALLHFPIKAPEGSEVRVEPTRRAES